MRFLVSVLPFVGHWQPVAAVARSLRDGGHEVLVVSAAPFRSWVESGGFAFSPVGIDHVQMDPWWAGRTFTHGETGFEVDGEPLWVPWATYLLERQGPALVKDLVAVIGDFGPDVLIHDSQEAGGPVAASLTGLPHAVVGVTCIRPGANGMVDLLRGQFGLPPASLFSYLLLERTPPSVRSEPLAAVAPTAHAVRPVTADDAAPEGQTATLPPDGTERPLVYASLGTVFHSAPNVMENVIAGLGSRDCDVVVTTGGRDTVSLGSLPENVTALPYVPQSRIFRRAAVAVTHGGFNSVMGALAWGVPLVVIPHGLDHEYMADRLQARGAAIALSRPGLTAEAVAGAVGTVLEDAHYRENAVQLAQEIDAMPGPEHAAGLLEELARRRAPMSAANKGRRVD